METKKEPNENSKKKLSLDSVKEFFGMRKKSDQTEQNNESEAKTESKEKKKLSLEIPSVEDLFPTDEEMKVKQQKISKSDLWTLQSPDVPETPYDQSKPKNCKSDFWS